MWRVKPLGLVVDEAKKMFRGLPVKALAVAIDAVRMLACFPEKLPVIGHDAYRLNWIKVQGENFYRYRVDDASFGNRSLRVFFYPHQETKTIWILLLEWRSEDTYSSAVKVKCRNRIRQVLEGNGKV